MKRFLCALLCLVLALTGLAAAAPEETDEDVADSVELTESDLAEIRDLDTEDDSIYEITGRMYPEPTLKDFDASSPALYTCKLPSKYSIFSQMDTKSRRVVSSGATRKLDILYVGLQWLIVRTKENRIGYIKREWLNITEIEPVDPVNTPPINVQKHAWIATTATTCHVRKTMDRSPTEEDDGNNWVILNPGTKISIWQFYEGWAMVNYMRGYGYIDPNELTDLRPVSPTDVEIFRDCPIAAYTSYYKMNQTENNLNRIHNIGIGCGYISVVVNPGEEFNANKIMGRYNASKGYRKAGVLTDGGSTLGYGGGTCQVSSTLFNTILQLPKIKILQRRAHGANGAPYLPIHCDAAVGSTELNLRWINGYSFPVRIEACSSGDGALSIRIYRAD